MRTKVTITNPDVEKELKVQKDGSVYLAKDLAGERVNIVAEGVEGADDVPRADIDVAISDLIHALDASDPQEQEHLIQSALGTLNGET